MPLGGLGIVLSDTSFHQTAQPGDLYSFGLVFKTCIIGCDFVHVADLVVDGLDGIVQVVEFLIVDEGCIHSATTADGDRAKTSH